MCYCFLCDRLQLVLKNEAMKARNSTFRPALAVIGVVLLVAVGSYRAGLHKGRSPVAPQGAVPDLAPLREQLERQAELTIPEPTLPGPVVAGVGAERVCEIAAYFAAEIFPAPSDPGVERFLVEVAAGRREALAAALVSGSLPPSVPPAGEGEELVEVEIRTASP